MLWYVSSKSNRGTTDGRSLDTPLRCIRHAIHLARPDDTIVIVPGVYDQDFDKRVVTARAAGVNVGVADSEIEN
jgi:hypothetical protein